jgi:hypothetical protein
MTKGRGLRQKVIFMAVLMTYGLVLFSVAHYLNLKIGLTTTPGDVVLQGFVNSRETGERLTAKSREIRGEKSSKSLLKMEERK